MAKLILHVGILLVVLCVADGQRTTSEDSHCSYTFKVPAGDCGPSPGEDQLLKSSVIALQAQVKFLAGKQNEDTARLREEIAQQNEDIRNLTNENGNLRNKIATIEAGKTKKNTLV